MDIRKIFGSNVRKYRIRKGLSQEKLAEYVDLGDKSISPIETGRSFIAIDKLEKLCEVLEVEPFQLFLTNITPDNLSNDLRKERVLTRLNTCNNEELNLLCDILTRFIER